ncbi:hypothetical protein [Actinomadura decatromicini]|uniref:Protein phosphatase 2C domain-containing protein n=1 Tax=Actinomadura decatromicini TaxID=2604572 RepID=A0A5D3FJW0_9ACTN|nr:hypothetical protein [Actinomadura decatromicini]TYK48272.1 hypothetical protein FXF68_21755 [Actinomadura decatromicini]
MRVSWATELGSAERGNEDFVAAAAGAVVVLDGCGLPLGTDLGCAHGTAWYARSLGTRLLARLLDGLGPVASAPVGPPEGAHRPRERPLVARLAGAIEDVAAAHRATCDLRLATTPAATVVAVRRRGELVDYLVLADSTLILDGRGGLRPITGGPYYAAADPAVADEAITGTVPAAELSRVLLLTDGATRLADMFGVTDWKGLADLASGAAGPAALIERTREVERTDPRSVRWPRGKVHDDATVAVCVF